MYKIRCENKKTFKLQNLSLNDSCLKIVNLRGGIIVDNRGLIAFWCDFEHKIKSGYAANDYEKRQINSIRGEKND